MNRRTWKEFITKRSTIWTLSLCLVGAIVLGSMAAVNNSRKKDNTQPETGTGQVAYLEEDLNSTDDNSSISTDTADEANSTLANAVDTGNSVLAGMTDGLEEASGTTIEENTSDTLEEDASGTSSDTNPANINNDIESASSNASTDDGADSISTNANADGSANAASAGTNADSSTESAPADTSIASDTDTSSEGTDADSAEAASANIISEQTLLEAGVSFTDEQSLLWPSAGTIAIDYSMDKSVYFATLNQYKYNPALIISSETGNQVLAAAKGIIESITIDEETGTTLVLNIGNGYKLTYGQLMEPTVSEGDVVEAGDLLAYISEPTKYYSTEGSNLYFAMTKGGEPVDPVLYFE
ncbi:MAG: peptidoglycan DD-metalloendopeptidase family protein [Lachnospiraceae bacterium]|nr:peptidoglycan DD-metalloendopeptidase family protein [Lachnospiraceae bacterium]